jgi:hypothetical protein
MPPNRASTWPRLIPFQIIRIANNSTAPIRPGNRLSLNQFFVMVAFTSSRCAQLNAVAYTV